MEGSNISGTFLHAGCDKFGTYCIVPFTRVVNEAESQRSILNELRVMREKGFREGSLLDRMLIITAIVMGTDNQLSRTAGHGGREAPEMVSASPPPILDMNNETLETRTIQKTV